MRSAPGHPLQRLSSYGNAARSARDFWTGRTTHTRERDHRHHDGRLVIEHPLPATVKALEPMALQGSGSPLVPAREQREECA
jgi:hypothetical protein